MPRQAHSVSRGATTTTPIARAAAAAGLALAAGPAVATPLSFGFLAEVPNIAGLAFGRLEATATYDPATAVNTATSTTRYDRGACEVAGTLRLDGRTANLSQTLFQLSEDSITMRESVGIAFIIDPPPFSAGGGDALLVDDDHDDGLLIRTTGGDPTNVDVNRIQLSFAGGSSNPGFLDGAGLPYDLAFLNAPPGGTGLQIEVWGVPNAGSLFSVLTPPTGAAFSGTWTALAAETPPDDGGTGAEVPLPATLPPLAAALAALGLRRRRD